MVKRFIFDEGIDVATYELTGNFISNSEVFFSGKNFGGTNAFRSITQSTDTGWIVTDSEPIVNKTEGGYAAYIKDDIMNVIRLGRVDNTTASSDNSSTVPNSQIKEFQALEGWVYFTDFPWVYSNRNTSWYYLAASENTIFAYNENIGGSNWIILNSNN